ncbi:CocE/NonD family hydrolase [Sphingopyxis sp. NJF-3]
MASVDRRGFLSALALSFSPGLAGTALAQPVRYPVRTVEPAWIRVSDGNKLAGRLWLPDGPASARFPVVLEYIPYRTFDRYRPLDDYWGAELAARGIAFARVDIRGSGNSEGVLLDEYLEREQLDGVDIIAWLAAQDWCNGAVGMRGISWGGFSALQVAAHRPPALKAIMPMCATDMRFRNDAHYVGGTPGLTNLKWAAGLELVMASPPDPAIVGPRWESMWRERLEATPSIAAKWLRHDSNDSYWRHGSAGLEPEAIACPTYLVDGWADSYAESAERLMRNLRVPRKAIFGPWGHIYPQFGSPGPAIDWIEEEERWWKHWLAGEKTGVMDGPAFRFYLGYQTASQTNMDDIDGHWEAEARWPSPTIETRVLHLSRGRLSDKPSRGRAVYKPERIVGLTAPEWIPYADAELPRDQSPDDERSLCFDVPLSADLDVVGLSKLRLRVASDKPVSAVAARLCEVDAEGRSWLISKGLLNLCFRDGFTADPSRIEPGRFYDVSIELAPIAHRLKKGNILRLAISDALWPLVWPLPAKPRLTIDLGASNLSLPIRPRSQKEVPLPILQKGISLPRSNPTLEISETPDGRALVEGAWPSSTSTIEASGTTLSGSGPDMRLEYDPSDRTSCCWQVEQTSRYSRTGWDCEIRVSIEITSTRESFAISERLVALKDGTIFFGRENHDLVARNFS